MNLHSQIDEYFGQIADKKINVFENIRKDLSNVGAVCVFGTGIIGGLTVNILNMAGVKIDFLCDNDPNKWDKIIYGLKCYSPDVLKNYVASPADRGGVRVVVATNRYHEILEQLKLFGVENVLVMSDPNIGRYKICDLDNSSLDAIKEKVHTVADMLQDDKSKEIVLTLLQCYVNKNLFQRLWENVFYGDDQYYPEGIVTLGEHESFVDCGAYNGDSLKVFLDKVNRRFDNFYAFEMEHKNFEELTKFVESECAPFKDKIQLFNYGVWNERKKIFIAGGKDDVNSIIFYSDEEKDQQVELCALDEVIGKRPVTFIKMDIEGAEMETLQGAKNIIQAQHPTLAISVYHKYEDIYTIPLYIKSLVEGYKIYFRCHNYMGQDIVCYAVYDS